MKQITKNDSYLFKGDKQLSFIAIEIEIINIRNQYCIERNRSYFKIKI